MVLPPVPPLVPHVHEGLSVGRLAAATGISTDVLRVWERRYGRPRATRLPSGHRRFAPELVPWLRLVAEAVAAGGRPGELLQLRRAELETRLAAAGHAPEAAAHLGRWLGWVRTSAWQPLREELAGALAGRDTIAFLEEVLGPFLVAVGREWARGAIGVRHEHLVVRELTAFLLGLREPVEGPRPCVLAGLPGEEHELPQLFLALVGDRAGLPVRALGTDLPLEEIASAAVELEARCVAISVSRASAGAGSRRLLRELRELLPADVAMFVGGAGARGGRLPGVERPRDLRGLERLLVRLPRR